MAFPIKEARLAARVGCNHEVLRTLRWTALKQGVDWQYGANRTVLYSESAVPLVLEAIKNAASQDAPENAPAAAVSDREDAGGADGANASENAPSDDQEAARVVAEAQALAELTVSSAPSVPGGHHFRNPRLVRATTENGEAVVVRTRDSRLYRTGTKFTAYNDGNGWIVSGRPPRRSR